MEILSSINTVLDTITKIMSIAKGVVKKKQWRSGRNNSKDSP